MMQTGMVAALVVSGVAGVGMMANEMTHGGVSETMGLGHQHMADYGGYHCASHMGEHGAHHVEHMHNETHMDHGNCPGGASMHDREHPMRPGGMVHG